MRPVRLLLIAILAVTVLAQAQNIDIPYQKFGTAVKRPRRRMKLPTKPISL